jgi:type III pantothenate kinase
MLLAIDAGNTNVVFALVEGDAIRQRWRIATDPRRTGDEYAVWLFQLLEIAGLDRGVVDAVVIATVVPRALHNLEVLATKYFGQTPLIVGDPKAKLGMRIDLPAPEEVGADRIVNALAAHRLYGGDLIIVDFGTATTFDIVDFTGAYKGGVISPGINLSLDALAAAAARLPKIVIEAPADGQSVIGHNTVDAMHSGVYWGYIGLIEGLVGRIRAEIGRPAKVVATGGLALLFEKHTTIFDHVDGDLTIKGLALIHARNTRK